MPQSDDRARWRSMVERAERVCEAARHDPYDPQSAEAMRTLEQELAVLSSGETAGPQILDTNSREQRAATHAAAGEAWFALLDSQRALVHFDAALEMLSHDAVPSPGGTATQAQALCGRGKCLVDLERSAEAIPVLDASIGWYTERGGPSDEEQQSMLSQALHTLGLAHADVGDHERALAATEAAVEIRRRLAECEADRYRLALSRSLRNLGSWLVALKRKDEAQAVREQTIALRREAFRRTPTVAAALALAQAAETLAQEFPDHPEALVALAEAVERYRGLVVVNQRAFQPHFQRCLSHLQAEALVVESVAAHAQGRRAEAVTLAEKGASNFLALVRTNPDAYEARLAVSLDILAINLASSGRGLDAVSASKVAVEFMRKLCSRSIAPTPREHVNALINFSIHLLNVGERIQGSAAAVEALRFCRSLAAGNREKYLPLLGRTLEQAAWAFSSLQSVEEAVPIATAFSTEAVSVLRELVALNRGRWLFDLARALAVSGTVKRSKPAAAMRALKEAFDLFNELAATNRDRVLLQLEECARLLSSLHSDAGHRRKGIELAQEAASLAEELFDRFGDTYVPELVKALANLGQLQEEAGQRDAELSTFRKCAGVLLERPAGDPYVWGGACLDVVAKLDGVDDLRRWHVPLLRRVVELRELAWGDESASTVRVAGGLLAERLWMRALSLAPSNEHVDEVVAALVAALHSPDLARWIEAHGSGDGPLAKLAELKRAVIEAEQQLAALRMGAGGGDDNSSMRVNRSVSSSDAQPGLTDDIKRQTTKAELVRRSFRDERARLVAEDPRFAAAFEPLGAAALRRIAGYAGGGALLCVLEFRADEPKAFTTGADLWQRGCERLAVELPEHQFNTWIRPLPAPDVSQRPGADVLVSVRVPNRFKLDWIRTNYAGRIEAVLTEIAGKPIRLELTLAPRQPELAMTPRPHETAPASPGRGRAVAALVYADGRRTQLLELGGVSELAWHAERYVPEAGNRHRGQLRGARLSVTRVSVPDQMIDDGAPSMTKLLGQRMSHSFWTPLQQALQESGVDVNRLHVCLHGTTQQLPLALRHGSDCSGLQVISWPGMPYLRRAAMAITTADNATNAASAPWLVGHDCAWGSEQPLPMTAVEAALLRDLLQRHGQPVHAIQRAVQLKGQPLAFVACCHGGAEQAQFDHALHLGAEPLTVRQIVQDNIGPPLALLPACHAGRTDEDAAGNALGVAAAFMLSGTKVVSASSKAVPDLLQPWLSTLTVWHAMQGLPHHEAAMLARDQFARLEFPDAYRSWLQEALPQALATIQPGGEEDPHIRGVHAHLALEQVQERWPWEGDTKHLFHAAGALRDEATRSVVQGILRPRGGAEGARALAAEAREMAAFVFVYGVDG